MTRLIPSSWWQASAPLAILTLLFNNLIPLLGVVFLGWNLYLIILVYWLENGVIGLFNALKMAMARGHAPATEKELRFQEWLGLENLSILQLLAKIFLIPFFLFHYGIFWLVHGVFVNVFFGQWLDLAFSPEQLWRVLPEGVLGALAAMVVSHGSSFVNNYIGAGEYLQATPSQLMGQPYSRVFILHLTIIGGGFLVASLGAPIYGLVLLIALKTVVDLWTHLREHKRYQG